MRRRLVVFVCQSGEANLNSFICLQWGGIHNWLIYNILQQVERNQRWIHNFFKFFHSRKKGLVLGLILRWCVHFKKKHGKWKTERMLLVHNTVRSFPPFVSNAEKILVAAWSLHSFLLLLLTAEISLFGERKHNNNRAIRNKYLVESRGRKWFCQRASLCLTKVMQKEGHMWGSDPRKLKLWQWNLFFFFKKFSILLEPPS